MRSGFQILFGSGLLCVCAIWHIYALSELITRLQIRFRGTRLERGNNFGMTVMIFMAILIAHTVQIYFWAIAFRLIGALSNFPDAIYFSLVTYATLGYGDIVLDKDYRIFGSMEAVTGVLMFGITTAFLVAYFSSAMRHFKDLNDHSSD